MSIFTPPRISGVVPINTGLENSPTLLKVMGNLKDSFGDSFI